MKIEINQDKCIRCGACVSIDSANIDFDSKGFAIPINQNITEITIEAKNACPVDAITIINNEDK